MTTAHDEVPVTYDKVEDVSKKRDAVLSNSVCKIPKAYFKPKKLTFLISNSVCSKNQIKRLLIHMDISIYDIM